MSTITREWLQQAINDYESVRDELPFGLDDYQGNILAALRIALASLEAEPIGAFHIAEQQVDGTSDYIKDGEWPIDNGIIEVYAAPPVPVVPAALPENDDEDGHDIDYLEPSEVYALGRTAGWNACRAAMLHGKSEQPQNAQQNIPENIPGGNSPVTPDGWVSCSERMPDKLIPVMVMYEDGEMWSAIWNGNRWDDGTEYPDPRSVTHWREMPAAPQQEVE
ncbi:TPA: DUF551 domain-containing protein [Escherichia coli]|uniref:DUF551 domain-containing protein n=2 Tax=Escherichia coli TaxID=562 RepID=UPI00102025CF|nr:DUF551 domain-containing protein [Escherichia coli]EGJ7427525.1 DUF551 domain-containing protein [Escherichia coli]EHR0674616.1 DUF551 domain-containing protein [Escherichia coli]EIA1507159.1 DUF551 domain-containing protein [Escherichia coli]EIQ1395591.1 DUF551 domain-containing protein [Escherichia coli]EJI6886571.1 DUF551 domain-containing protein [Escherichia coli]